MTKEQDSSGVQIGDVTGGIHGAIIAGGNVQNVHLGKWAGKCGPTRPGARCRVHPPRKQVCIFLASPGDVRDERDRLSRVVEQFNRGTADRFGLTVELLHWETHATPDVGRP